MNTYDNDIQYFKDYLINKTQNVSDLSYITNIIKSIITTYQTFTILNDEVHLDVFTVNEFKTTLSSFCDISGIESLFPQCGGGEHTISKELLCCVLSDIIVVLETEGHEKGSRYSLGDDHFLCLNVEYKGVTPCYEFDIHEHEDNGTRKELSAVLHYNNLIKKVMKNENNAITLFLKEYTRFLTEVAPNNIRLHVFFKYAWSDILQQYNNCYSILKNIDTNKTDKENIMLIYKGLINVLFNNIVSQYGENHHFSKLYNKRILVSKYKPKAYKINFKEILNDDTKENISFNVFGDTEYTNINNITDYLDLLRNFMYLYEELYMRN